VRREGPRSAAVAGQHCTSASAEVSSLERCAPPAKTVTVSAEWANRGKNLTIRNGSGVEYRRRTYDLMREDDKESKRGFGP